MFKETLEDLELIISFEFPSEFMHLKNQIESEQFPSTTEGGPSRYFRDLPKDEQQSKLKDRLKKYCQKVCWMLKQSVFLRSEVMPLRVVCALHSLIAFITCHIANAQ